MVARPRKAYLSRTMPDDTSPALTKTPPAPAARPALAADRSPPDTFDAAPAQPAPRSILAYVFGAVSVALLITVIVLWSQVRSRNTSLVQNQNHSDQVQAGATVLQAQLDKTTDELARVQKQKNEADAESAQNKSDLAKSKAGTLEIQGRIDQLRINATAFQTQMEEAKVASIKHQGEVEIARAQTTVAQTALNESKAESAKLQTQLDESKALVSDVQAKLAAAEKNLVAQQKPAVKR